MTQELTNLPHIGAFTAFEQRLTPKLAQYDITLSILPYAAPIHPTNQMRFYQTRRHDRTIDFTIQGADIATPEKLEAAVKRWSIALIAKFLIHREGEKRWTTITL